MKIYEEFKYLCYQLDFALGQGNLIDSDFSEIRYEINDKLSYEFIKDKLIELKNKCQETIDDNPPLYLKTYLNKHIEALIMQINLKIGNVDYLNAINVLYDIEAVKPDHNIIEQIQEELNDLLNQCGYDNGTLNQRINRWDEDNKINASDFIKLSYEKAKEYANLVKKQFSTFINLDRINDTLELKLVNSNQGWSAYNYYIKDYTGIIEFNSVATFNKYSLDTFISHEGYPGHHTSGLIKELLYRNNRTNELATINLLNTPSSLIEEGIGDCGLKILHLETEDINFKINQILDKLNAEAYYYAAYEYINNRKNEEQIMNILINDKLHKNEKSANRALQFIKNWGYYIPTYKYGQEIVGQFIDNYSGNYLEILYNLCCNSTLRRNISKGEKF